MKFKCKSGIPPIAQKWLCDVDNCKSMTQSKPIINPNRPPLKCCCGLRKTKVSIFGTRQTKKLL